MSSLRPLGNRVAVKRISAEEKSGDIIIPDSAKEKPMEGIVVSVGQGNRLKDGSFEAIDLKIGDRVVFPKWAGTEFRHAGEDLLIIKADEIHAVVEG